MLTAMFYWLLSMSITAAIAGLLVLCLRRLPRLPRRMAKALWILPLVRMWLPFGLHSKYSLMSLLTRLSTRTVVVYYRVPQCTMMNSVAVADGYFPLTFHYNLWESLFAIASTVWFVVAAILLLCAAGTYISSLYQLKNARRLFGRVYLSDRVDTPAVYGVFRPKIVLPHTYEPENLRFILLHENVHIQKADNLWRIIAIVTACVHWFNPAAWLFLKAFLSDLEFACDEAVLAQCQTEERKDYAAALLHCAAERTRWICAFGGSGVRRRITRILSYQKLSAFSAFCFAALFLVAAYLILTNAG